MEQTVHVEMPRRPGHGELERRNEQRRQLVAYRVEGLWLLTPMSFWGMSYLLGVPKRNMTAKMRQQNSP